MTDHEDFLANFPAQPGGYRMPPAGFDPHLSGGGYSRHNGPFYQRLDGHDNYRGFYVLDRHCNSMGIAHGGLLVSFVDGLLGMTVYRRTRKSPITVRLTTDFTASAKLGEWVEGKGTVIGVDEETIFVEAQVYTAQRTVLVAQGVFKAQVRAMNTSPPERTA